MENCYLASEMKNEDHKQSKSRNIEKRARGDRENRVADIHGGV